MELSKQTFSYNSVKFDCYIFVTLDGKFWFKAKDIAEFLEYRNTNDTILRLVSNEWKCTWSDLRKTRTSGFPTSAEYNNWQDTTIFISEPGLWALVSRSNKPEALRFQKWLFEEVLPTLRKIGAYVMPNISESQIDKLIKMLQQKDDQLREAHKHILQQSEQNNKLCNKILDIKPRVAVMPYRKKLQHIIRVYKNKVKHEYVFIRPQERNIYAAVKHITDNYDLIFKRDRVPNAINILNRVKERFDELGIEYVAKNNTMELNRGINMSVVLQDICNE